MTGERSFVLQNTDYILNYYRMGLRVKGCKFRHILTVLFALCIIGVSASCNLINRDITIVDARTAVDLDEKMMPVKITDAFPPSTTKVACWINWKNAKINTQLVANWHYVTDDIHILDHIFTIPRKNGTGGVILSMPDGKNFPAGLYKVTLLVIDPALQSPSLTV